jgi:hypothetical protein
LGLYGCIKTLSISLYQRERKLKTLSVSFRKNPSGRIPLPKGEDYPFTVSLFRKEHVLSLSKEGSREFFLIPLTPPLGYQL